jgi:hypothetical protein
MASQILQELKLQELQNVIKGLESDTNAEFCFFFGDLNYRLNTDYAHLNTSNIKEALENFHTLDQLTHSRSGKNYPGYSEPTIDFLPGYKMSFQA